MCKRINDSILSREEIAVRKIWAPDVEAMEEALDRVNTKVVVLQAFTRDLTKLTTDEMMLKITGLVEKALRKADKVVISTIIRREDVEDIDLKANTVNLEILKKYRREENVVICDNHKLYESYYRIRDKLHLSKDGIPVFASNLKYAIAKAYGVEVKQRRWDNSRRQPQYEYDNQSYDRYDRRGRNDR